MARAGQAAHWPVFDPGRKAEVVSRSLALYDALERMLGSEVAEIQLRAEHAAKPSAITAEIIRLIDERAA